MKSALIIEQSISVKASVEEAWHAWTDRDELENWWGESVLLEPKLNGRFQEKWEDDKGMAQVASGLVLKLKRFEFISFSWREKTWPPKVETLCEIHFKKNKSNTVIELRHSGWENLPAQLQIQMMKDFKLGWGYHLKELKAYLDG